MLRVASHEIPASQFGADVQEMVQTLGFGDFSEPLRECAHLAREDFGRNFAAQSGPHSGLWPARKQQGSGKIGEKDSGHPLEIKSGLLAHAEMSDFGEGAITNVGYREAVLAVDPEIVPYAAAQNYGNPKGNLPQRESFDIQDDTADKMAEVMADAVLEQLSF